MVHGRRYCVAVSTISSLSSYHDLLSLLSTVEVNMGIFCSCLPLLPPLFRQVFIKEIIASKYRSLISLLRSGDTSKSAASSQKATNRPSRPNDTKDEEYLELVDEAKADMTVTPDVRGDVPIERMRPRTEIFR